MGHIVTSEADVGSFRDAFGNQEDGGNVLGLALVVAFVAVLM